MFRLSLGNTIAGALGIIVAASIAFNAVWPGGLFSMAGALLLLVLVLAGLGWVWQADVAARHRRELQAFADRVGWDFRERTLEYTGAFTSYPFGRGDEREDIDVLSGTFQGYTCSSFTHAYTDQNDDRSLPQTYEFQVTTVELPVAYPTIDILPDDLLAKVAKLVGGMDVNFESAAFNRRWRVKGPDARYVHAMITPRVMHRLVQDDTYGLALRLEGRFLLCWRAGREGSDTLAQRFGMLTSIAKALPPHMERQMREAAERRVAEQEAREAGAPAWARTPRALTSGYRNRLDFDKARRGRAKEVPSGALLPALGALLPEPSAGSVVDGSASLVVDSAAPVPGASTGTVVDGSASLVVDASAGSVVDGSAAPVPGASAGPADFLPESPAPPA